MGAILNCDYDTWGNFKRNKLLCGAIDLNKVDKVNISLNNEPLKTLDKEQIRQELDSAVVEPLDVTITDDDMTIKKPTTEKTLVINVEIKK